MSKPHSNVISFDENVSYLLTSNLFFYSLVFLGLMLCNLVCHFEDEITHDRSPRVQEVSVLVVFKLFRRPLLPACGSCSVFPVLEEL